MAAHCAAMEVAKRDLETVAEATKISSNTLGYMVLKKSGLDREEKNLVLARADETFDFTKVSTTLNNLFPLGEQEQKRWRTAPARAAPMGVLRRGRRGGGRILRRRLLDPRCRRLLVRVGRRGPELRPLRRR